ncbi:MAG: TraB/GumN family protein [Saprospiraceae bacterium]|nr:TraB/GumN family protein [Saprospiraceae bacterium]
MAKHPSVLFEIIQKGNTVPHYIFGTMHMDNEDAFTHVETAIIYLKKCDFYYAEMNLDARGLSEIGNYFLLKNGTTLDQIFKRNHYVRIKKILLKSFGIDLAHFIHLIPFYIQTLIAEKALNSRYGLPLDHFLWQKALESGKNMGGVETFEDQIGILQQIPMEIQIKSLRTICKNISVYSKQLKLLSSAYKNKDIKSIYTLSKKQLGGLKKLMLYDRNEKMVRSIIEKCGEFSSFFAVGAAHLYGSKGILNVLKSEDFKVRPVFS